MQVLVQVYDDTAGEATGDEMAAIDAFNDRLRAEGHWVFAGGLEVPELAVTVDARGGRHETRDGALVHASQHLAGLGLWQVPDRETALRLAREASEACNRQLEVRFLL